MGSDWDDIFFMVSDRKRPDQEGIPDVFHVPQCDGNDVYESSADEIQHLLSTKAMTSVSLVKHCLERIRRVGLTFDALFSPLSNVRSTLI